MSTLAAPPPAKPVSSDTTATRRLMSIDALRGFDMFWILGADSLVYALNRMSQTRPTAFLANQLDHADWEGFHFYDLIFPLFVFIVGVSLVFSLSKAIEQAGRAQAISRVIRRGVLLYLIGLFYSGGFSHGWPDMRLMGVLNRIALAYLFAGLFFCFFKPRALAGIWVALLISYWGLMTFVPIRDIQLTKDNLGALAEHAGDSSTAALFRETGNPSTLKNGAAWTAAQRMFYATTNYVSGQFGPGHNLSDHIDFQYLPGKKWDNFYDPEGFLSTIPAVATCLLGALAGLLLRSPSVPDQRKVAWLVGGGVAAVTLGWLWGLQFPVIKKIWTSSYVLVAGGYSAVLVGLFYQIVDIWQIRAWCQPFVWIGMNSITIYLTKNAIGGSFSPLASRLVGGDVKKYFDAHVAQGFGEMMISIVGLLLAFWFVRFLYKRGIFLRL